MSYALSLLDKSPIPPGASAAEALQRSVSLAQRAEQLGYRRFWVAEHHGNPGLASSAPEVLIAHILSQTSRIRVGSGGVMLQHYSPFKVAETFKLLAALAPGRVDLGIGKAPGGLPLSTKALQWMHSLKNRPDFAAQLSDLEAFLEGTVIDGHALSGAVAYPIPPELPERFLLGGSPASAALAAGLGWDFTYAGHFNSDPANIERSISAYQTAAGRPPSLALYAFAAESREEAEQRVGALRTFKLHLPTGQSVNLPSLEAACEFARQAGISDYRTEETRPYVLTGTAQDVRQALDTLSARHGIQEFIIDTPVPDFAQRWRSVELIAGAEQAVTA